MNNTKNERPRDYFKEYAVNLGMRSKGDADYERRLALIQNMYYNPESEAEGIESIPGYRKIYCSQDRIYSLALLCHGNEKAILFHSGDKLYRLTPAEKKTEIVGRLAEGESRIFSFDGFCLIANGEGLYSFTDRGLSLISDNEKHTSPNSVVLMDGRLFLSVGEDIIFSDRTKSDKISFPEGNRIAIGENIISLTVFGGRIWVFTESRIICLDGKEGYPLYLSIEGVRPLGQAMPFGNEIIFLSRDGLFAVENPLSVSEIKISCKSRDIAPLLSDDRLSLADLSVWMGYALICSGEQFFLARPDREGEPQWYMLSGIGAHPGDRRAFRYSDKAEEGYHIHKEAHSLAEGEVISLKTENGKTLYFVEKAGKKYAVYPTEERIGGSLSPADITISDGRLLCFSAGGEIFLFNNDIQELSYSTQEYYSFDGHAPVYLIRTHFDRAALPVNEKSSEGESLYLKIKSTGTIPLTVTVSTDKGRSSFHKLITRPSEHNGCRILKIPERAHGWIEKQIEIRADEYASPFALCSMAYKYQVNKN